MNLSTSIPSIVGGRLTRSCLPLTKTVIYSRRRRFFSALSLGVNFRFRLDIDGLDLATAGGIVFYGDPSGDFAAADERDGKTLWHFPTNGINKASPMTFAVDGKQLVALAVAPNILCFGLP